MVERFHQRREWNTKVIRTKVELAIPILTSSHIAIITAEYQVVVVFSITLTSKTRNERALNTPTLPAGHLALPPQIKQTVARGCASQANALWPVRELLTPWNFNAR